LGGLGTALEHRDSANGSGPVNIADFNSWKAHFGEGSGNGGLSGMIGVPEPTSLILLGLSLPVLLRGWYLAGRPRIITRRMRSVRGYVRRRSLERKFVDIF